MDSVVAPIAALLIGYALGSVPFGILLTRLSGPGHLTEIGSGDGGATDGLGTRRKGLAAAALLLDGAKGTAALLLCEGLFPGTVQLAAIGAMLGHLWPVWIRFAGGVGVATYFGIVLGFALADGLAVWVPAAYAGGWIGTVALTRYSSLGGLVAALVAPFAAGLAGRFDLALLFLGFTLLVFWTHRGNIVRLAAGNEPRVGGA